MSDYVLTTTKNDEPVTVKVEPLKPGEPVMIPSVFSATTVVERVLLNKDVPGQALLVCGTFPDGSMDCLICHGIQHLQVNFGINPDAARGYYEVTDAYVIDYIVNEHNSFIKEHYVSGLSTEFQSAMDNAFVTSNLAVARENGTIGDFEKQEDEFADIEKGKFVDAPYGYGRLEGPYVVLRMHFETDGDYGFNEGSPVKHTGYDEYDYEGIFKLIDSSEKSVQSARSKAVDIILKVFQGFRTSEIHSYLEDDFKEKFDESIEEIMTEGCTRGYMSGNYEGTTWEYYEVLKKEGD